MAAQPCRTATSREECRRHPLEARRSGNAAAWARLPSTTWTHQMTRTACRRRPPGASLPRVVCRPATYAAASAAGRALHQQDIRRPGSGGETRRSLVGGWSSRRCGTRIRGRRQRQGTPSGSTSHSCKGIALGALRRLGAKLRPWCACCQDSEDVGRLYLQKSRLEPRSTARHLGRIVGNTSTSPAGRSGRA